jgi:simple sugar transport system permease protein
VDERIARRSALSRLLTRPEVGALMGAIVIYLVFFAVAPPSRWRC